MKLYLKDIKNYAFNSSESDKIKPNIVYYDGLTTVKDVDSRMWKNDTWSLGRFNRNCACVYFLLDGHEVVYIGQTKCEIRPKHHKRDKQFNSIWYIPLKDPYHIKFEQKLLSKYKTKYNKMYFSQTVNNKNIPIAFKAIYNSMDDREYSSSELTTLLNNIWKFDNIQKQLGNGVFFTRIRHGIYIKNTEKI